MADHQRRPLWLHVGCSKTGTSSLQAGLWESVDALARVGIGLPYVGRRAHLAGLVRPLGWNPLDGFTGRQRRKVLRKIPALLRATPGEALLLSNEELAEARPEDVDTFAGLCEDAGVELRVVLSVRGWAHQLPSDYQQLLKHRLADSYVAFLDDVRDGHGAWAEKFRRRQDPIDILDRWGRAVDPSRAHLVVVPSYEDDAAGIFTLTSEALGIPADVIARPEGSVNTSLGVVESEVWRRFNAALGKRIPDYRRDYNQVVRWPFAHQVLARNASERLTLPPEHLRWVQEHAERTVATARERGYRVHGDLEALVPDDSSASALPMFDEADVAAASIRALANYAAWVARQRR